MASPAAHLMAKFLAKQRQQSAGRISSHIISGNPRGIRCHSVQALGSRKSCLAHHQMAEQLRCYTTTTDRGEQQAAAAAEPNRRTISSTASHGTILLTKIGRHVTHIELNKQKSKNAFGFDSARDLVGALSKLEDDPAIRCIILSGCGPNLTSGVDLKSFMTVYGQLQEISDPARKSKLLRKTIHQFQAPFKAMHAFAKPIVSVAHGLCYGLGMELAACSDIRYCSADTKFSIREVLIGIAADVGSLQLMPRLVSNRSLLNELIYTGRDFTIEELRELGFVSKVLPSKEDAIEQAIETAQLIAERSPLAVQGSKQNLRFSEDKSFATGLDYNAIWNMSMMQGSDVEKAIGAILSKADQVEYEDF